MAESTSYASFRQRLDAVLRTRDMHRVRAFLIEERQWTLEQPADPEYAMWLMIAGTATLKDLHSEARQWLVQHGHGEAAEAILGRGQPGKPGKPGNRAPGKQGANPPGKAGSGPQKEREKKQQSTGSAKPPHGNER